MPPKGSKMSEETKKKISSSLKGHACLPETRRKIGLVHKGKKVVISEEHRQKISKTLLGHVGHMRGRRHSAESIKKMSDFKKAHPISKEQREQMNISRRGLRRSFEIKKRMSEAQKGDKGSNWQGGRTSKHQGIRMSFEYKLWREAVFKRDNYTCIWCGKRGGVLNADHIKPFAIFPELRFALDNGRTLCPPCHKTTDTYGRKTNRNLSKL